MAVRLKHRISHTVGKNGTAIYLLAFVALLALGQMWLLFASKPDVTASIVGPELSVSTGHEGVTEIRFKIRAGRYDLPLRVSAIPGAPTDINRPIFVFYEAQNDFATYRSIQPYNMIVAGLGNDLPAALRMRGMKGEVKVMGNDDLPQALWDSKNGILILPAVAASRELIPLRVDRDRLLSWVSDGGTVFLIGFTPYYRNLLVRNPDGLQPDSSLHDVDLNQKRPVWRSGDQLRASYSSPISEALGLRYELATTGIPLSQLQDRGGKVLGKTTGSEGGRASIASLDVGAGHLVIFGGGIPPVYGSEMITEDIVQIIQSGILETDATPLYRDIQVRGGASVDETISMPYQAGTSIKVLFFATDEYHLFYSEYYFKNG